MSVHVTAAVWDHSTAKGSDLLVQLRLADQANRAGWCWPGHDGIARTTRLSRATVQRALSRLEAASEIEIHPRPGSSNRYRVTPGGGYMEDPLPIEGTPQDDAPQNEATTGEGRLIQPVGRVTHEAGGCLTGEVSPASPGEARTVIEPSEEPSVEPPAGMSDCDVVGCDYPDGHGGAHRNPWWDAVEVAVGYRIPANQASRAGQLVRKVRDAGGSPASIVEAAQWIAREWGPAKLTLHSLYNHWERATGDLARLGDVERDRFREQQARQARRDRLRALPGGTET